MNHDDPKITAYALGELPGSIELDRDSARIVRETEIIGRILSEQLGRRRRRSRLMRYWAAACLLLAVGTLALMLSGSFRPRSMVVATHDSPSTSQTPAAPILHLMPALAELVEPSSISRTNFRGIREMDVDQLVAAVLEDASRVGSFRPLRLTPESPVAF